MLSSTNTLWATNANHIILNFWIATLKMQVKLIAIYIYFTQYMQILLFQQVINTKIINEIFYVLFYTNFPKSWCILYTYTTCQFGVAAFMSFTATCGQWFLYWIALPNKNLLRMKFVSYLAFVNYIINWLEERAGKWIFNRNQSGNIEPRGK